MNNANTAINVLRLTRLISLHLENNFLCIIFRCLSVCMIAFIQQSWFCFYNFAADGYWCRLGTFLQSFLLNSRFSQQFRCLIWCSRCWVETYLKKDKWISPCNNRQVLFCRLPSFISEMKKKIPWYFNWKSSIHCVAILKILPANTGAQSAVALEAYLPHSDALRMVMNQLDVLVK